MKIFQIGFNRCGTSSIYHFFRNKCESRPRCVHWAGGRLATGMLSNSLAGRPLLEGEWEGYDVYTDMQAFVNTPRGPGLFLAHMEFYRDLDVQYPGSRFILNTRGVDSWVSSRRRHYGPSVMALLARTYGTDDVEGVWRGQWEGHHRGVREYFGGRSDLLVFDIERDMGSKIADFLPEMKFRDTRFPKMN